MATPTTAGGPHAHGREELNTGSTPEGAGSGGVGGVEATGTSVDPGDSGDLGAPADGDVHLPRALPPLPWLSWEPGTRVVVRYRLADGLHDALGDLLEVAADHVTVRTRRGDIRVEASTMVTGKRVPPPVR